MTKMRLPCFRVPFIQTTTGLRTPFVEVGICEDEAGVVRKEHFFVDERCFHCGAKEKDAK